MRNGKFLTARELRAALDSGTTVWMIHRDGMRGKRQYIGPVVPTRRRDGFILRSIEQGRFERTIDTTFLDSLDPDEKIAQVSAERTFCICEAKEGERPGTYD